MLRITPHTAKDKPAYQIDVEARNAAKDTNNFMASGLTNMATAYTLATADGHAGIWSLSPNVTAFAGRDVPSGAAFTYSFKFTPTYGASADDVRRIPAKLILQIKTNSYGFRYSVPDPSFRVDLTCKK